MALSSPGWRDRHRLGSILGSFTVGLLAGAVLSAVLLWLLSGLATPLPAVVRYGLILGAAGVAVLRDLGIVRLPLPQNAWQVPQDVLHRGGLGGPLRFGIELGTGVRTYVSASAPYVLAIAVLAAGLTLSTAALTGVGFGLGRATTPALRAASPDPAAWDRDLRERTRPLTVLSSIAVAAALAVLVIAHHGLGLAGGHR